MIATEIKLLAAIGALAGCFAAGWYVQCQRMGLQIEQLQHAATSSQLRSANAAVDRLAANQEGLNNALDQFQKTQQANAKNQAELGALLRDVRGTTAGLRGDFANLPERINTASASTLAEYTRACTNVFESMAAAGGKLAENGAGLAAKADGHAADARLMQGAWPKR